MTEKKPVDHETMRGNLPTSPTVEIIGIMFENGKPHEEIFINDYEDTICDRPHCSDNCGLDHPIAYSWFRITLRAFRKTAMV